MPSLDLPPIGDGESGLALPTGDGLGEDWNLPLDMPAYEVVAKPDKGPRDRSPELLFIPNTQNLYPRIAQRRGISGRTVARLTLNREGRVVDSGASPRRVVCLCCGSVALNSCTAAEQPMPPCGVARRRRASRGVYARIASPVGSSSRIVPSAPYANAAAAAQDLPRSTVQGPEWGDCCAARRPDAPVAVSIAG